MDLLLDPAELDQAIEAVVSALKAVGLTATVSASPEVVPAMVEFEARRDGPWWLMVGWGDGSMVEG